ncbi:MAG: hypothetical protein WB689_27220, partial [Xanthobacteraceae bacterium]
QQANSGRAQAAIGSPKFRMVIGPFYKTELFIGAGMGYHSNDARSTVITEVPGDPEMPQSAFLANSGYRNLNAFDCKARPPLVRDGAIYGYFGSH